MLPSPLARPAAVSLSLFLLLVSPAAHALQPVETFLASAHTNHPDARAADATARQRDAEVGQARARLLPSLSARGIYTHNQFEAVANFGGQTLTIVPQNQLDAFFVLDVPLVDLGQWARYRGQQVAAEAAEISKSLTRRQLDERVVRAHTQLAATHSLGETAAKSQTLAEKNLANVELRRASGLASELDVERASASVERAKQDVADAELAKVLSRRALESLSRLTPEAASPIAEDDLHEEAPLATWLGTIGADLPERRAADAQSRLAASSRDAARYAYLPTLSAQGQERLTNATGFTGRVASYTLSATLSFRFDFGLPAQSAGASAAADVARARADGTLRDTEDVVLEAWHRVGTGIAKARASRAQAHAAERAARITEDRYAAGTVTQLDVTQAARDAFAADVGRIQADLDLAQARHVLRIAAGKPLSFRPGAP